MSLVGKFMEYFQQALILFVLEPNSQSFIAYCRAMLPWLAILVKFSLANGGFLLPASLTLADEHSGGKQSAHLAARRKILLTLNMRVGDYTSCPHGVGITRGVLRSTLELFSEGSAATSTAHFYNINPQTML